MLHETVPDGPVSAELVRAATHVLRDWPWETRPAAVVTVPSGTRPQLIASLAAELASLGRLELLGPLDQRSVPPSGVARTNSAHRVRALHGTFEPSAAQRDALQRLGQPAVLLIDDQVDSGWTMAMAGRALRLAGAGAVLPLALAKVR